MFLDHETVMEVEIKLIDFQCFLANFCDVYDGDIETIPKREIILPWNMEVNYSKYLLFKKGENILPDKINVNKIKGLIKNIEMKLADEDVDTLINISNYSLLMLENTESGAP